MTTNVLMVTLVVGGLLVVFGLLTWIYAKKYRKEEEALIASKGYKGLDITEVWDYRLSNAVPVIDRSEGTWKVHVFAKDNKEYRKNNGPSEALEVYDTGIESVPGDEHDVSKVIPCFEWLRSVRDKYSAEDIEERKPYVKKINEATKALAALGEIEV